MAARPIVQAVQSQAAQLEAQATRLVISTLALNTIVTILGVAIGGTLVVWLSNRSR
jgi:hypothetical protein